MDYLIDAFLFFLPAGIANASPVIANKIPLLNQWDTPLDFGAHLRGKRLFGANKTWRGLLFGTFVAGLTSILVSYLFVTYAADPWQTFLIGCALGFGALFGDAIESMVKRQKGVPPGQSWFPFDQTDYIIGGLLFVYPFTRIPLVLMLGIFILYFGLHLIVAYIGFLLGLKDKPI